LQLSRLSTPESLDLEEPHPPLTYLPALNEGFTIADMTSKTTHRRFTFNNTSHPRFLTVLTLAERKGKGELMGQFMLPLYYNLRKAFSVKVGSK